MADAQDLKSWDPKKSCEFESHHRHQVDWGFNRQIVHVLRFLTRAEYSKDRWKETL